MLWTYEAGTQLLWRDAEALVFIQERNSGWHGGAVEWYWQVFRNALSAPTSLSDTRVDLLVLRYSNGQITSTFLEGVLISALQQMDGDLYSAASSTAYEPPSAVANPLGGLRAALRLPG